MAEVGWVDKDGDGIREKEGKKLTLKLYSPEPSRYMMGGEVVLAIQEYLRKVGFECSVQFLEYSALTTKLWRTKNDTKGDGVFLGLTSETDGWFILGSRLHSKHWYPDKKHTTFYRNIEFDKLLDEAEVRPTQINA